MATTVNIGTVANDGTGDTLRAGAGKINDGFEAITSGVIAPGTVTSSMLADGSVTTVKLAASAVTTAKISDANVTSAKLASGAAVANIGFTPANVIGAPRNVATRTALKAVDTTITTLAYLSEGKRNGLFIWTTGDYSTQVTADTTEGMFVKATAIASTVGAWVRVTDRITPQMCGAAVDGITNDYAASYAAFQLAVREKLEWNCPAGEYAWNLGGAGVVWDPTFLSGGARRAIRMTGAGTRATYIEITNSAGIAWQIASTTDWFDLHLSGFTVRGSFNFPLLCIGRNDFADPVNMLFIQEVSVENSYDGSSNVAVRLNYIAGGATINFRAASYALAVADVLVAVNGTALECRQAHFISFSGGGLGNADRAVDFKDGTSVGCSFNSPTLENANYCVSNRSANSGAHTFNACQMTNVLVYEVYSSAALSNRDILIINPNCDGICDVDPANYQKVRIKDDAAVTTPIAPATTVSVTNTTGRDVEVTYWGLTTLSSITIDGAGDGITATSGSFILRSGKACAFAYTGTLTWRWRNAG